MLGVWLSEIAPEPFECFRENGAPVFPSVSVASPDHSVIVVHELEGRFHLLVCQWPVAVAIVEIVEPVL